METKCADKILMKLIFKHFLRDEIYIIDEIISLISKTAFNEYYVKEEEFDFCVSLREQISAT
jgi:hypothetical protein